MAAEAGVGAALRLEAGVIFPRALITGPGRARAEPVVVVDAPPRGVDRPALRELLAGTLVAVEAGVTAALRLMAVAVCRRALSLVLLNLELVVALLNPVDGDVERARPSSGQGQARSGQKSGFERARVNCL